MSYIDDEELKTSAVEEGFEEEAEEDALEIDDAFIDPIIEEDGELLDEVDAEEDDVLEEFQELDEDGNY